MGITPKTYVHATEREREDVRLLRWLFRRERFDLLAYCLLFFDDSGINLALTRTYRRAPGGTRAYGHAPESWGDNVSLAAGIGLRGFVAPLMLRGSMTGAAFEAYVEKFVVPALRAGDIVVWGNLGAHMIGAARRLIDEAGARIVFLPPYSPDLNAIEMAWSKVKTILRSHAARTWDALVEAAAIAPNDIAGWFRRCGYDQLHGNVL